MLELGRCAICEERRKREGNFSVNAVGVPEVSQALEHLHLGPRQREDQMKITEFLLPDNPENK